jgi:hypothetical protein
MVCCVAAVYTPLLTINEAILLDRIGFLLELVVRIVWSCTQVLDVSSHNALAKALSYD